MESALSSEKALTMEDMIRALEEPGVFERLFRESCFYCLILFCLIWIANKKEQLEIKARQKQKWLPLMITVMFPGCSQRGK